MPDNADPDDAATLATVAAPLADLPIATPPDDGIAHRRSPLRSAVAAKLSLAMFLHHFALGSWVVTLGSYINANAGSSGSGIFSAGFVGVAYGAGPIGGMVSPFLTGILADRYIAAERLMAVLSVCCATALSAAILAPSQWTFFAALLVYFLCFLPSFSLTASMSLHHLDRPHSTFPIVRACGTLGWIAAGVLIGGVWPMVAGRSIEATSVPMKIGVGAELITAAFCLWLPHTPPLSRRGALGSSSAKLWTAGTDLLFQRRFAGLLLLAALAHVPSQFYYAYGNVFFNWTRMSAAAAKMTLGQVVEVACMLLLPAVLLRIRMKTAIVIGLAVWAARFWMLSAASSAVMTDRRGLIYAAILLHGVAYTFVSISLQLEVDRCAGHDRKATAQGLLAVAIQGFGCFMGAELAGLAGAQWLPVELEAATPEGWATFWALPAWGAAAVCLLAWAWLPRN